MLRRMFIVLALLLLVACGSGAATPASSSDGGAAPPSAAPNDEPATIIGQITQVGERVLVEEQPGQADQGSKIYFAFAEATEIFVQDGDQLRAANVADLQVGQRVQVWASGPMLESYPAQGGAAKIVVMSE